MTSGCAGNIAGTIDDVVRSVRASGTGVSFDVNRFYPKTQLSWLARLDHSHCNSADPLTDGLEVCCVFYRPGPGGCYVCCVVVEFMFGFVRSLAMICYVMLWRSPRLGIIGKSGRSPLVNAR